MIKNILISLFIGFILLMSTIPSFFITELSMKEEGIVTILNIEQKEEDNTDILAIVDELQKYKNNNYNLLQYEINYDNLLGYSKKNNVFRVQLYCSKLKIDNEVYYFKSKDESENFKKQINEIKEKEIEITETVAFNEKTFTSQEELNNKIAIIKEEKRKEEEEAKRIKEEQERQQRLLLAKAEIVSSRSGNRNYTEENYTPQYSDYGGMGVPMASYVYISSHFGERSSRRSSYHTGTDFAAPAGTHIYAWKSGVVTLASWNGAYGNMVIIEHEDGTVSRYGHMSGFAVAAGQYVEQGQTIGYVGSTR